MTRGLLFGTIMLLGFSLQAQMHNQVIYKVIDTTMLRLHLNFPEDFNNRSGLPAMVFFFGGGWNGGTVDQFEEHAKHFASHGIVCFRAEYRVKTPHGTSPFESLGDAKTAMRFIRKNAKRFKIDPDKIIAAGGSAGGHLAAATALIDAYDDDQLVTSCVPDALVLFNPVIDNGPEGYAYDRIGSRYKNFSPIHNIKEGVPPTLFMVGTNDKLIPVSTAEKYKKLTEEAGSRCDLKFYEGKGHGWFNYRNRADYDETIVDVERFLRSLGYLK